MRADTSRAYSHSPRWFCSCTTSRSGSAYRSAAKDTTRECGSNQAESAIGYDPAPAPLLRLPAIVLLPSRKEVTPTNLVPVPPREEVTPSNPVPLPSREGVRG